VLLYALGFPPKRQSPGIEYRRDRPHSRPVGTHANSPDLQRQEKHRETRVPPIGTVGTYPEDTRLSVMDEH